MSTNMSNAGINAEQYTFVVKYPRKAAARLARLEAERDRLREALLIVAGEKQCIDSTLSNMHIAKEALK